MSAKSELQNILACKKAHDQDSIDGLDGGTPLFYLRLHNSEREYSSSICLCESELKALKTMYQVEWNHHTRKVYTLELESNSIAILAEVQTTLKDVWSDEKLRDNLKYRLSEGITPYSEVDVQIIDDECELIWDMGSREPQFVVKRGGSFILPQDALDKKANMPFYFSGGTRAMIDANGKYGVISTGNSLKADLDFRLLYPFEYHYIRLDGFGNAELLREPIEHGGDYKKLLCRMVDLQDSDKIVENVLLNSTTRDEYITIDSDGLLTQHTQNGVSKPYQTIMLRFFSIKPVQDVHGLWGYIDKNASEIIPCKFKDWNFFNDGYAVLEEDGKYFIIDTKGDIVIDSLNMVKHYKDGLYFVNRGELWGIFKKGELFIEFCDKRPTELVEQIQNKKRELHTKIYEMPLKKYMTQFDTPKTQTDLQEMGLWGKMVNVKKCQMTKNYESTLKDPSRGAIGWQYPVGGNVYDMSIELPVAFTKKDGSSVSLGINFEHLSLQSPAISKRTKIMHSIFFAALIYFGFLFILYVTGLAAYNVGFEYDGVMMYASFISLGFLTTTPIGWGISVAIVCMLSFYRYKYIR